MPDRREIPAKKVFSTTLSCDILSIAVELSNGVDYDDYIHGDGNPLLHTRTGGFAPAVLQRGAQAPAAHRRGGDRAGQAHRARRSRGQGPHDQLESAARDLGRAQVPGPGASPGRPDPGGHARTDPRSREVRLAQGVQVLDLRNAVDS